MRVFAFFLLLLAVASAAADESRLQQCAGIADDTRRLACYDDVAGRRPPDIGRTIPQTAPDKQVETSARVIQTEQLPPPRKPASILTEATSEEDDFGLEHIEDGSKEKIASRYDGEFTGWSGRTLFKLENGQVWRQAESGRFRTSLDRPMIIIERGAFSSYRLKIEGLNRSVRVKRVR